MRIPIGGVSALMVFSGLVGRVEALSKCLEKFLGSRCMWIPRPGESDVWAGQDSAKKLVSS